MLATFLASGLLVSFALSSSASGQRGAQLPARSLFLPVADTVPLETGEVRARLAVLDEGLLETLEADAGGLAHLSLFDDERHDVSFRRAADREGLFRGWAPGAPRGTEVLLQRWGAEVMLLFTKAGGGYIRVFRELGSAYRISEFAPAPAACLASELARMPGPSPGRVPEVGCRPTLDTHIDVLFVFTNDIAQFPATNLQARIMQGEVYANAALSSSGVGTSFRVAAVRQVDVDENGRSLLQLMSSLRAGAGEWREAHRMRAQYGADMLALVAIPSSSSPSANGYIGTEVVSGRPTAHASMLVSGYEYPALTTLHLFAHEVGHNTGLGHESGTVVPAVSYGLGYKYPSGCLSFTCTFATVMVKAANLFAPRVAAYSTPAFCHGGGTTVQACGASGAPPIGVPGQHDAAASIDLFEGVLANVYSSTDYNENRVPDECEELQCLIGYLAGDPGLVDPADLLLVEQNQGLNRFHPSFDPRVDFNQNGVGDPGDGEIALGAMGLRCYRR